MFLSVIIPTRNRAKYLTGALESLTKQTYPLDMFEVLVIDNGSTDNTREVCASFKKTIPQLRYFYEKTPGLHVGRHLGMKMTKSEILVYADDDIEAFPTWLEGIAEVFKDNEVVLVGGKNLPKYECEPPYWLKRMWDRSHTEGKMLWYLSILDLGDVTREINPLYVYGCNFAILKRILIKAGGFHPDGMPQEQIRLRGDGESHVSSYISRNGYKAHYHPKASVYHLVPESRMTEEYFCTRAYNQGISDSYIYIREGQSNLRKGRGTLLGKMKAKARYLLQARLDKKIYKAYRSGFEYHQAEVRNDPKLYEWVMKKDYFDV